MELTDSYALIAEHIRSQRRQHDEPYRGVALLFNGDWNNPKRSDSARRQVSAIPGQPDVLMYDGHIPIGGMNHELDSEIARQFLAKNPELAVAYASLAKVTSMSTAMRE